MRFRKTTMVLRVPVWPEEARFRAVLLADLHDNALPDLLPELEKISPEAVFFAGDAVTLTKHGKKASFARAQALLRDLAARWPVYFSEGNHELRFRNDERQRGECRRFLQSLLDGGVIFLDDRAALLEKGGARLRIHGLSLPPEAYRRRGRLAEEEIEALLGPVPETLRDAEENPEKGEWNVLLAHHPDYLPAYAAWGADLVLSGHVHGGVIRLPGIGGLIGPGLTLFPRYSRGLYTQGKTRMAVTAGLGMHTVPLRIFDPREIVILELRGGRGSGE